MISHAELISAFGESGVTKLPTEISERARLLDIDAFLLTHVGLPKYAGPLFTTTLPDSPRLFDLEEFPANGEMNRVIFLGGPEDSPHGRYFLDAREGFIVLMAMYESGESEVEVINSSLSSFLRFVHLIGVRFMSPMNASCEEDLQEIGTLERRLREEDAHAFRSDDTWWTMAVDAMRDQTKRRWIQGSGS